MDIDSIISLDSDGLFELANDTDQSMLCDWREEPDAVVEYANAFLPDDLHLEYTEDDDGLVLSNRNGRHSMSFDDYEGVEEPIPLLVHEINRLIAPSHEARYFKCVDGTDGYSYLLRPGEFWQFLDTEFSTHSERIFRRP